MELLKLMQSWSDQADAIALSHFSLEVATETKKDGTPVTIADREIELFLRDSIAKAFPDDVVVGEELGGELPRTGAAWIIDPIDGTKNFARGVPIFATLIARWEDGALTDAIVSAPALGRRWWAAEGTAYASGMPIRTSGVPSVAEADICTGGLQAEWLLDEQRAGLHKVLDKAKRHRGLGDFWGYMLVAQGSVEAMIEFAPLKLWDIAAPRCILQAAGGVVTDFSGDALLKEGPCVASNGLIHKELLVLLDR